MKVNEGSGEVTTLCDICDLEGRTCVVSIRKPIVASNRSKVKVARLDICSVCLKERLDVDVPEHFDVTNR